MSHLGRRAALAGAAALLTAPRARAADGVVDALGRDVALKGPASRIVLGFNYEEFTAVAGPAGWDRVVGFGRALWAGWRPASYRRYLVPLPRLAELADVGNTDDGTFSLERVLSLRPDLVILAAWSFDALAPQVRQLEALGVPVLAIDYNAEILDRHVASTLALGVATGNEERAHTLASLYAERMADIARRVEGARRPRAYVELGQGGAGVVGNTYTTAMWGKLLDVAGAENIALGHVPGPWGKLAPEFVLAVNPEAVFIAGSSWVGQPDAVQTGFDATPEVTRARLAPYRQRQGWAGLAAIRDNRLFAIEHGLCRSLPDYAATAFLAKQLHPDRFTDVDPVAELRNYHERFLPVPLEGCWMTQAVAA